MSGGALLSGGRIVEPPTSALLEMDFPQRLAALRKERALTQDALAAQVGIHVSQLRRYEAGKS